jgi:hypothetical protein
LCRHSLRPFDQTARPLHHNPVVPRARIVLKVGFAQSPIILTVQESETRVWAKEPVNSKYPSPVLQRRSFICFSKSRNPKRPVDCCSVCFPLRPKVYY